MSFVGFVNSNLKNWELGKLLDARWFICSNSHKYRWKLRILQDRILFHSYLYFLCREFLKLRLVLFCSYLNRLVCRLYLIQIDWRKSLGFSNFLNLRLKIMRCCLFKGLHLFVPLVYFYLWWKQICLKR